MFIFNIASGICSVLGLVLTVVLYLSFFPLSKPKVVVETEKSNMLMQSLITQIVVKKSIAWVAYTDDIALQIPNHRINFKKSYRGHCPNGSIALLVCLKDLSKERFYVFIATYKTAALSHYYCIGDGDGAKKVYVAINDLKNIDVDFLNNFSF